jgi:c-di-GMP-binding flagellar brake protein YcgR
MIEKRSHGRIDCATKCILYHDGSKFRGVVENLSIAGALVIIRRNLSGIIHPGDVCCLLICHPLALSYSRHASQVKYLDSMTNLDSTTIGIQFLFIVNGRRQRAVINAVFSESKRLQKKPVLGREQ